MKKIGFVVASCAALAGCQTNYTYEPIVSNPPNLEMTHARCEMMSAGTQQGYIAIGSQSYVAGAALGNAIGNAVAADNFIRQCMTINGWRRVTKSEDQQGSAKGKSSGGITAEQEAKAVDILALAHIAELCKISIKSDKRSDLKALRQSLPADVLSKGRLFGEKTFNDNVKTMGRSGVCKKAAGMTKDVGWT